MTRSQPWTITALSDRTYEVRLFTPDGRQAVCTMQTEDHVAPDARLLLENPVSLGLGHVLAEALQAFDEARRNTEPDMDLRSLSVGPGERFAVELRTAAGEDLRQGRLFRHPAQFHQQPVGWSLPGLPPIEIGRNLFWAIVLLRWARTYPVAMTVRALSVLPRSRYAVSFSIETGEEATIAIPVRVLKDDPRIAFLPATRAFERRNGPWGYNGLQIRWTYGAVLALHRLKSLTVDGISIRAIEATASNEFTVTFADQNGNDATLRLIGHIGDTPTFNVAPPVDGRIAAFLARPDSADLLLAVVSKLHKATDYPIDLNPARRTGTQAAGVETPARDRGTDEGDSAVPGGALSSLSSTESPHGE